MTLTSPTCPLSGVIINSIENAIKQKFENANVNIELTFDPVWTPEKIKNEEIKQIFL
jgi:metal-sulfur cluster biosynthetic enzyme